MNSNQKITICHEALGNGKVLTTLTYRDSIDPHTLHTLFGHLRHLLNAFEHRGGKDGNDEIVDANSPVVRH